MSAGRLDFMPVDMSAFDDWPEFRALACALDEFAQRAGRETQLTQIEAERQLVALARNLAASDCCHECLDLRETCAPIVVSRDEHNGGILATYVCERGHRWQTWWGPRELLP